MIACMCGCGRIAMCRGLSTGCYTRTRLRVKAGKTSWEQLEKDGKCLPAKDPLTMSRQRDARNRQSEE